MKLAYLTIIRPENAVITAFSVFIAGVISNPQWVKFNGSLLHAALSAALIAAGGNAYNDYCDRELDRIQKPHRPIPAGKITEREALVLSLLCFAVGLLLAVSIGSSALLIAAGAILLLLSYSWRWKRTPLFGNLVVAYVAALAFIYGGVAVDSIRSALWAALLAFFFHLAREVIKDMEDLEGDAQAKANTLIVRYGLNSGRWTVDIAIILLILTLPLPYYLGNFNSQYLWITGLGVFPVLLLVGITIWFWSNARQMHKLSVLLKWDMLIGLAALLLGRPTLLNGLL